MENGLTNLEDLFVGNRVFQVPIYQRNLCSCEKWDDKEIEKRENQLISFAKSRWGIPGSIAQKTLEMNMPKSSIKD